MKKETAVEWLVENLKNNMFTSKEEFNKLFKKAVIMETKQIIDAWDDGVGCGLGFSNSCSNSEEYYKKTFL